SGAGRVPPEGDEEEREARRQGLRRGGPRRPARPGQEEGRHHPGVSPRPQPGAWPRKRPALRRGAHPPRARRTETKDLPRAVHAPPHSLARHDREPQLIRWRSAWFAVGQASTGGPVAITLLVGDRTRPHVAPLKGECRMTRRSLVVSSVFLILGLSA